VTTFLSERGMRAARESHRPSLLVADPLSPDGLHPFTQAACRTIVYRSTRSVL
jgi:hypothetical protein